MSHNLINYLEKYIFIGIENIQSIDLRDNLIHGIHANNFNYLSLQSLNVDDFFICCISNLIEKCNSPISLFSSCSKLIKDITFQSWIWIIISLCLLLNIPVIINTISTQQSAFHKLALLKLAISDLMYGAYLSIFTTANIVYGNSYAIYDYKWRSSIICHVASALAITSILCSCLSLSEIAIFRYFNITKQGSNYVSKASFIKLLAIEILFCLLVNAIPFLFNFGNVSQPNGICMSLISSDGALSLHSIFPTILVNIVLLTSIILISVSYLGIMIHMYLIQHSLQQFGQSSTVNIKAVSLRLIVITVSNILCWLPTIIISVLSVCGVRISAPLITALVTVIMHINSVINPTVFTFMTKEFLIKIKALCGHK